YGSIEAAVSSLDRHTHDPEKGVLFFELWRWLGLRQRRGGRPWPFDRDFTEQAFDALAGSKGRLMSRTLLGAGAKHTKEVGVNTDVHRAAAAAAAGRGSSGRGHSLVLREGKKDSIGGGIRNRAMRGIALEKRSSTGKLATPTVPLEELQDGLEAVSERHAALCVPSLAASSRVFYVNRRIRSIGGCSALAPAFMAAHLADILNVAIWPGAAVLSMPAEVLSSALGASGSFAGRRCGIFGNVDRPSG
ncbi:hypothetical protein FOZ63_015075, partial [Perkinsus olseni]